jgi:hypothetical protein
VLLDTMTWDQLRMMVRLGIEYELDKLETLGRMQAGSKARSTPTGRDTRRKGVHIEAREAWKKMAPVEKQPTEQARDVQADLADLAAMGFAVEMG